MKIEESDFKDSYLTKLAMPFGNFYVYPKFMIGESFEGIHFNWEKADSIITQVRDYFGEIPENYSYISNRVHSYSVAPQDWLTFYKERNVVHKVAIVAYSEKGFLSVALEKMFSRAKYQKFNSLAEAVAWVQE